MGVSLYFKAGTSCDMSMNYGIWNNAGNTADR